MFINEYIPPDDKVRYGLAQLDRKLSGLDMGSGKGISDRWTIDRDNDAWLRPACVQVSLEQADTESAGISFWDFYWKGTTILLKVQSSETESAGGIPREVHRRVLKAIDAPPALTRPGSKIREDLRSAFWVFQYGDEHLGAGSFEVTLEFEGDGPPLPQGPGILGTTLIVVALVTVTILFWFVDMLRRVI